jgi:hypothetical protein
MEAYHLSPGFLWPVWLQALDSEQQGRVKLAHFFELIFKSQGLLHLLYRDLWKLILVSGMLNKCLYQRRVKFMLRKSSKGLLKCLH